MPYIERYGVGEDGDPAGVRIPLHVGDIVFSPLATPREGTLVCDGSEVSREAYAELYQEIGALVGQGDGSTTFNLPDLRGKWLMGADTERATGTEVDEGLPNITGGTSPAGVTQNFGGYGAFRTGANLGANFAAGGYAQYNFDFDASRSSAVYGASDHVTPASVTLYPCIIYEA